jgi:hypothetical protein
MTDAEQAVATRLRVALAAAADLGRSEFANIIRASITMTLRTVEGGPVAFEKRRARFNVETLTLPRDRGH